MMNTTARDSMTFEMPLEITTSEDSVNSAVPTALIGPIDPREWYKHGFEFELYGYFMPIMTVLIFFLNVTMLKVFFSSNLMSPTNILIGTIAVFDILTITMPCIVWFYIFGILHHHYFLPFEWCRVWHDVAETMPSVFHSIVIVLNVVLVIQRYSLVAFPYKMRYVCTRLTTCICILVVVAIFSLPGMFAFFEYSYFPTVLPSSSNVNETMIGCFVGISPWIKTFGLNRYISVRLYIRAATILLSCIIATCFCILTLRKCKQVFRRRKQLTQNINMQKSEARLNATTITIIGAFVITELPSVIIITMDAVAFMTETEIIPGNLAYTLSVVNNTFIFFTGMLNFLIYFYFCESFRSACLALWCCKRLKKSTTGRSAEIVNISPVDIRRLEDHASSFSGSRNSISENPTISSSAGRSNADLSGVIIHL